MGEPDALGQPLAVRRGVPTRRLTGTQPIAMKGLVKKEAHSPSECMQAVPKIELCQHEQAPPRPSSPSEPPTKPRGRSSASAALQKQGSSGSVVGSRGTTQGPAQGSPFRARAELAFPSTLSIMRRRIGIANNYKDSLLSLEGLQMSNKEEEELYADIQDLEEHLIAINLSNNCFIDIASTSAIATLRGLTDLNLDCNGLTHVPSALYSTLPLLTRLSLAGNHIRHFVPSSAHSSVAVGSVDCCCSDTLTQLLLDLSRNRFHEFPDLSQFSNLLVLKVSGNMLSVLPSDLGTNEALLPSLASLAVDDNALSSLPPHFELRAAHLRELRLSGNAQLPPALAIDCQDAAAVSAWILLLQGR